MNAPIVVAILFLSFIGLVMWIAGRFKRRWIRLATVLALILAVFTLRYWIPIGINLTDSLPKGTYYYTHHEPLRRGVIIAFPQPQKPGVRTLRLPLKGSYLMKYVAARPGDTLDITPSNIFVRGKRWPNSQPDIHPDPRDHRLLGHHVVTRGYVWALGTNTDSFDSRFFGEVPIASIVTTQRPLRLFGISPQELCNDTGTSPNPCFLRTDSVFRK